MATQLSPQTILALVTVLQRLAHAQSRDACQIDLTLLLDTIHTACTELHGNAAPMVKAALKRRDDQADVFDDLAEAEIYRDLFWDPDYLVFTKTLQLKSRALADRKRAAHKEPV